MLSKTTKRNVLILFVFLGLGFFAFVEGFYPNLQFTKAVLTIQNYSVFGQSSVNGAVEITVNGRGVFMLNNLSGTLDAVPVNVDCDRQPPQQFAECQGQLPLRIELSVSQMYSGIYEPTTSSLIVTMAGTWFAFGNGVGIPVEVSGSTTVQWTNEGYPG